MRECSPSLMATLVLAVLAVWCQKQPVCYYLQALRLLNGNLCVSTWSRAGTSTV